MMPRTSSPNFDEVEANPTLADKRALPAELVSKDSNVPLPKLNQKDGYHFYLIACVTPVSPEGSLKESRPEAMLVDSDTSVVTVYHRKRQHLMMAEADPDAMADSPVPGLAFGKGTQNENDITNRKDRDNENESDDYSKSEPRPPSNLYTQDQMSAI
ncbi:MAG: hypothetical protein Q9183_003941 [Haloplaca sp. 2 TL-2023]